jgi:anhydro-N-acetylmuramic acid kinase
MKMEKVFNLYKKEERLIIGLMSGTSLDGIDAAIVKIKEYGFNTHVQLVAFETYDFTRQERERIALACSPHSSNVRDICQLNFDLGEKFAQAAVDIAAKAKIHIKDIDLIGSHGQTLYHIPGQSTLQIGEPSLISEKTGVITVGDFRVRDVAAGGQGAPLVPYTEYILYRNKSRSRALQNIGGIGNVTVIPKDAQIDEVFAFDTGPGNMMIDACVEIMTEGRLKYDQDGNLSATGSLNRKLLGELMDMPFIKACPPKTTGRELFGFDYTREIVNRYRDLGVEFLDILNTLTSFSAKSIAYNYRRFVMDKVKLDQVIIGGGGSYNKTLVSMIKQELEGVQVLIQEDLGFRSDAKEAIAFAILANETIMGRCNNLPRVTGANKPVVLGKIII